MKHFTLALTLFVFHHGTYAQQKDFEGIINFSFTASSQVNGITPAALKNMLLEDDRATCYIKNGNFKWESARAQTWFLHQEKRQYLRFPGIDTLYYVGYDEDTTDYKMKRLSDKKSIAGAACDALELRTNSHVRTFHFAPQLYLNPEYSKDNKLGGYNLVAGSTSSIWLRLEEKNALYGYVEEATKFESVPVSDDKFRLPELPKTKFEIWHFYEEAKFGNSADAWNRYVRNNINAELGPKHIKLPKGEDMATKQVIVSFLIDEQGNVLNVMAENKSEVPAALAREAVRVVSESPRWKPAKMMGRNIFQFLKLPLTFAVTR